MLAQGRIRRYGTLESSLDLLLEAVTVLPLTPRSIVGAAIAANRGLRKCASRRIRSDA